MDEKSIFIEALQRDDPDERAAYLDAACADQPELRQRIEALLRRHDDAGSFLEKPPVEYLTPETVLDPDSHRPDIHGMAQPAAGRAPGEEPDLGFLDPCDEPDTLGQFGSYEILEVLGAGGMGVVLKARDPKLNRILAIKVLAPQFAANAMGRKRFLREGRAAAAISHDHVVSIHGINESEHLPFLMMEYVEGLSLQQRIDRDGPLELKEILRIGKQAALGLAAAHDQGLIHRDIKPSNILLENSVERVRITDFGLARAVDDVSITRTGVITGTPQYMSPEQAQNEPVDHRSDLFSLGSVLYAMCTGRSPFRGDSMVTVIRRVCDDEPRPIREVNPDIPEWLVAIIDRLLAKDPDKRFQTASEVADLLGRYLAHLQHPSVNSMPPTPEWHGWRSGKSSRARLWATVLGVLMLLAVGLGVTETIGITEFTTSVIGVFKPRGTSSVDGDDPGMSATVDQDGEEFTVSDGDTHLEEKNQKKHSQSVHPGVITPKATRSADTRNRSVQQTVETFPPIAPSNANRLTVLWRKRHRSSVRGSVAVVGNTAYYGDYGNAGRGTFYAVNTVTGQEIWSRRLVGKCQGHAINGKTVYVSSHRRVEALDAASGEPLWTSTPWAGKVGGLVAADGILYVRSSDPPNLWALDAGTGDSLWHCPKGDVVVSNNTLYRITADTLYAQDPRTGKPLWQVTVDDSEMCGPAVSNDVVYGHTRVGRLYAFDATDRTSRERSHLWVGTTEINGAGDGPQSPAVGDGKVFVGAGSTFYAFDTAPTNESEKQPVWTTTVDAPFFSTSAPRFANGVVYTTAGNHYIYAFDANTGAVLWSHRSDGTDYPMRSTPTIANGRLYHLATFDFTLYAFHVPVAADSEHTSDARLHEPSEACTHSLIPKLATGWKLLFDGEDTSEWHELGGFRVVEGELRGPRGELAKSRDEYGDFELEFEWRISSHGNGGVYYRERETGLSLAQWQGTEYQLLDNQGHPNGRNPGTNAGSLYGRVAPSVDATKPLGEFNTSRILARGSQVEHWMNGKKLLSYNLDQQRGVGARRKGFIYLQSDAGEVAFRRIRIRELKTEDSSDPPPPKMRELSAADKYAEAIAAIRATGVHAGDISQSGDVVPSLSVSFLSDTKTNIDSALGKVAKALEGVSFRYVCVYTEKNIVTDEGLRHLKSIRNLGTFYVTGTNITDASLEHLKACKSLKILRLTDTQVTKEGCEELKKTLPKVSISLRQSPSKK